MHKNVNIKVTAIRKADAACGMLWFLSQMC